MPEVTISLSGHDEELAVFGSRDQYLRQVRDALGVKVVARHGEVRVEGDSERVELARQVFEQLRDLYQRKRAITSDEVADAIDAALNVADPERPDQVEIREGKQIVRPRTDGQGRYLQVLERQRAGLLRRTGRYRQDLPRRRSWPSRRCGAARSRRSSWSDRPSRRANTSASCPGDLEAKINPYLRPLLDALHDLMDYDQIRRYMGNDLIEIAPLAYMRGRTLNDAVIILDEGQNATVPQMKMFLTRMGQNARIVVTGDITQVDLPQETVSGLADAVDRLEVGPRGRRDLARQIRHRSAPAGAGDRRGLRRFASRRGTRAAEARPDAVDPR